MKKILLIEDNNDIRENTAEILELANYRVFTAGNGKEGVEIALKEKPDLIICDIMMPVLDGYGVLHLLNKNPETHHIPFIFLSAKTERADVRKGMALGADDYITKPFEGTELLEAVEGRLKKASMIEEKIAEGLEGFNQLMTVAEGKDIMQSLREGRNINKYKKKQIIYSEGNRPSRLYYIQKGKVRTYKSNENAKELAVGLYNEGDFLGYIALLEGTPYKETAEAMEDCELAVIPKEDFESLLNNNREIAKLFIKLLAKNISEKEEQLLGLAYNSLRKKVADAIITLNKKYNAGQDPGFSIHISRENLATIAGTATESLIRTLSDFKNEQLIDIKNGSISILNEKKLLNMLN
ncbi:MAG TPA: response regulator [Chitinophagaceae bacterium]|nr:response regulator [Chitinophagaceae bacterium]